MSSVGFSLNAVNLPEKHLAFTNKAYTSEATLAQLWGGPCKTVLADVNGCIFTLEAHAGVAENGTAFSPPRGFELGILKVEVDLFQVKPGMKRVEIKGEDLEKIFRKSFNGQAFTNGQPLVVDYQGQGVKLTVISLAPPDLGDERAPEQVTSGVLVEQTELDWQNGPSGRLHVLSNKVQQRSIFRPDFNFEELGIGGLDKEFGNIFRRAFAARVFPPHIVRDLGITHVRGMLLHGPPGTGKTLIARQLAKFLKAAEPKIVNGPEILNKYVGQAEENIRNLFTDAEKEYKQEGENSQLHVIIFDEIDSICKARGSKVDGTGVHDSIVNQLLSKIDGVDALNNILLIGMTNRKDLIDEALLRPGRLEVHVEISLPDEDGRAQILNIHTKSMREKNYLHPSVSIPAIATSTKNFSGAELAGLIRSATSFAFNRKVNVTSAVAPCKDFGSIEVTNEDFEDAMLETKPLLGQHADEFEQCARYGIMHFSQDFEYMLHSCQSLIEQVRSSENTPLLTCLLHGSPGCGKTAIAAHLAQGSDFPFVRRIGPESYVGYTEQGKVAAITKIFEDAYKSPLSLIVLDDLERLMDYVPIGPSFSRYVLSALFSLLKKQPPKSGRRLLIIGTTSAKEFLQDTEILRAFNVTLNVPMLSSPDHVRFVLEKRPGFRALVVAEICAELSKQAQVLSISTLLLVAEMALQRQDPVSKQVFMDCLRVAGDA
eukprot:CAMPEP_0115290248 /NCGR_PEP_ID=MMETSP0270-20121206/63952_1 /TAXON_ID=71861 /ORGANISM="Scrippsiella trochoidea, Strain CCMP3099" /LENGTH=712 /DNA_ID=CAMNT_0002707503 /DNA_START=39 /DNA_END=2177 /DNA_ORIENTATION=+